MIGALPAGPAQWLRRASFVSFVATVLVQLVVLYAPTAGGPAPFPQSDKVVHLLVFALPVFFALAAGMPLAWVTALMAVHAVVSEVVQAVALSGRSGDPWDCLTNLVGVLVGAAGWRWLRARAAS